MLILFCSVWGFTIANDSKRFRSHSSRTNLNPDLQTLQFRVEVIVLMAYIHNSLHRCSKAAPQAEINLLPNRGIVRWLHCRLHQQTRQSELQLLTIAPGSKVFCRYLLFELHIYTLYIIQYMNSELILIWFSVAVAFLVLPFLWSGFQAVFVRVGISSLCISAADHSRCGYF